MEANTCRIVLAVTAILALAFGVPPANASTQHADRPGGVVTFDYSPTRVDAGDLVDMDLSIGNCSDQVERLRLRVRTSGPCSFPHPVRHTYKLDPHFAVGSSSLIVAPSCRGRYSVRLKLTLAGSHVVLDTARGGFFVR